MPGEYAQDAIEAYESIKEDGGAIVFLNLGVEAAAPADEALPWEGSVPTDEEPPGFPHFAIFGPLSGLLGASAGGFGEAAYIPAHKLPAPVVQGTNFRRANGEILSVAKVIPVQPAGDVVILYMCEVNPWPGT